MRCMFPEALRDINTRALHVLKSHQHFINYRLEDVQTSAHLLDLLRELQHQFQHASTASPDHWEEPCNRRRVALFGVLCPEEMRQLLQEMLLTPLHLICVAQ